MRGDVSESAYISPHPLILQNQKIKISIIMYNPGQRQTSNFLRYFFQTC
jgi:hypothetical protein